MDLKIVLNWTLRWTLEWTPLEALNSDSVREVCIFWESAGLPSSRDGTVTLSLGLPLPIFNINLKPWIQRSAAVQRFPSSASLRPGRTGSIIPPPDPPPLGGDSTNIRRDTFPPVAASEHNVLRLKALPVPSST